MAPMRGNQIFRPFDPISSSSTVPFTKSGVSEKIRSMAPMRELLSDLDLIPSALTMSESEEEEEEEEGEEEEGEEKVPPFKTRLCEEDEREKPFTGRRYRIVPRQVVLPLDPPPACFSFRSEMVMPRQRDRPMEPPPPDKLPGSPYRNFWCSEPQHMISRIEKKRADSPSSESLMSTGSMDLPVSVIRPASCESMKSDQSMGPPIAFKRDHFSVGVTTSIIFCGLLFLVGVRTSIIFSSFLTILFTMSGLEEAVRSLKLQVEANKRAEKGTEDSPLRRCIIDSLLLLLVGVRTSFILCGSLTILFTTSGFEEAVRSLKLQVEANQRQRAGSPVPSCLSLKSDRSMTPPLNFSGEHGPSDTKDPGIKAGLCTNLDYKVAHLQNEMNMLKRQQREISEEHTGVPENN